MAITPSAPVDLDALGAERLAGASWVDDHLIDEHSEHTSPLVEGRGYPRAELTQILSHIRT